MNILSSKREAGVVPTGLAKLGGLVGVVALWSLLVAACGPAAVPQVSGENEPVLNLTARKTITIGDIDPGDPAKKINRFQPLADYLARELEDFGFTEGRVAIARDIEEMARFLEEGVVDVYLDSAYPTLAVQELSGARPG